MCVLSFWPGLPLTFHCEQQGRPLWFMVASYHDTTVTLMYNQTQLQLGQQYILVFQWRLTRENVNAEIVGVLEWSNTGNVSHKPWLVALRCIGVACELIMLLIQNVLESLDIRSYVFVQVGVWYFNHKQRFSLAIWERSWFNHATKVPYLIQSSIPHDDVIKWKHFPRYWHFVRGIHRSPVNSPHKGQWRGALIFSLICVWINGWVNNREAGDLRRYRVHYDFIVMKVWMFSCVRQVRIVVTTWNFSDDVALI